MTMKNVPFSNHRTGSVKHLNSVVGNIHTCAARPQDEKDLFRSFPPALPCLPFTSLSCPFLSWFFLSFLVLLTPELLLITIQVVSGHF